MHNGTNVNNSFQSLPRTYVGSARAMQPSPDLYRQRDLTASTHSEKRWHRPESTHSTTFTKDEEIAALREQLDHALRQNATSGSELETVSGELAKVEVQHEAVKSDNIFLQMKLQGADEQLVLLETKQDKILQELQTVTEENARLRTSNAQGGVNTRAGIQRFAEQWSEANTRLFGVMAEKADKIERRVVKISDRQRTLTAMVNQWCVTQQDRDVGTVQQLQKMRSLMEQLHREKHRRMASEAECINARQQYAGLWKQTCDLKLALEAVQTRDAARAPNNEVQRLESQIQDLKNKFVDERSHRGHERRSHRKVDLRMKDALFALQKKHSRLQDQALKANRAFERNIAKLIVTEQQCDKLRERLHTPNQSVDVPREATASPVSDVPSYVRDDHCSSRGPPQRHRAAANTEPEQRAILPSRGSASPQAPDSRGSGRSDSERAVRERQPRSRKRSNPRAHPAHKPKKALGMVAQSGEWQGQMLQKLEALIKKAEKSIPA